jgi:hypothetical protein
MENLFNQAGFDNERNAELPSLPFCLRQMPGDLQASVGLLIVVIRQFL